MIHPGDTLWGEVTKSRYGEDVGVKVSERDGKMWVVRVQDDGLFRRWGVPLEPGDRLLQINGRDVDGLTLDEVRRTLVDERHVTVQARRAQYGLHDSSASGCAAVADDRSDSNGED